MIINKPKISNLLNRQLELTILPTEKCNLDCIYCYEDFKIGKMDAKYVEAIKKLINIRAPELEKLTIQWFGGEPLLGYSIIMDIMHHVNELQNLYSRIKLISTITTNAYLLSPNKLSELVSLGVNEYQITFDGDKTEHDKLRIRRGDMGGSFDNIWNNIVSAHHNLIFQQCYYHCKVQLCIYLSYHQRVLYTQMVLQHSIHNQVFLCICQYLGILIQ